MSKMAYFLIIRGPLGCGKTTVAKHLANKLDAEYISIDALLEKYGLDQAPPDAETIPAEHFIQAQDKILPEARKYLQKGKVVIFEGNFQHKAAIEHLLKNLFFPNYTFTLKAPIEVCIDRDSKREKAYGEDAVRALYDLTSQFQCGISIDTTLPMEDIIDDILSHVSQR